MWYAFRVDSCYYYSYFMYSVVRCTTFLFSSNFFFLQKIFPLKKKIEFCRHRMYNSENRGFWPISRAGLCDIVFRTRVIWLGSYHGVFIITCPLEFSFFFYFYDRSYRPKVYHAQLLLLAQYTRTRVRINAADYVLYCIHSVDREVCLPSCGFVYSKIRFSNSNRQYRSKNVVE